MSFDSVWHFSELGKEAFNASRPFSFKTHPKVVFVNTSDVLQGHFLHANVSCGDGLPGQAKKALKKEDILLTEIRPGNGRFAYVDFPPEKYVVSTKFMVIETYGRVTSRFLYHVLTNQFALDEFQRIAESRSGTFPQITFDSIEHFPVPVPPKETQAELTRFFDTINDRIALLRETNATLEAIAQALFKSWFVDFDPVRAKMEGRAPEGMDEATAALFPDSFEESALGLVPKGWRVGTVEDICDFIANGGTPSRAKAEFWIDGSMPWFKTGDFSDGFLLAPVERITETAIAKSSVKVLPADAILMAIYAAPTVGRLGVLTEPATFNQACTGMVAKNSVGPWFLFLTLFFGRVWFNSRANGAAQQNISKAIVSSYKIVVPPPAVLAEFHQLAERLYRRIRACSEQAQTLATLRDTLLPRLISGQLRLPEAGAPLQEFAA